jgi:imidazolonepropionase-like amidohydrolase
MIRARLVAAVFGVLWAGAAAADTLVIHAGTLLVEAGEEPLMVQTVVVEDGRIIEVRPGFAPAATIAADAVLVDLSDRFVLPGLMDMHVHLLLELSPTSRVRRFFESDTFMALRGASFARKTLEAGFTTVRDLGGNPESIYALRDAIAAGLIPGPRILAAGSALAATGGHGDVDGYRSDLMELFTPKTICDGAVDCRRAVRYAVKHGADWIKITATGGVLSDTATGLNQQMTDDELVEIMDTAHSLGLKVAAHAHGAEGVNAALRAGVDSIDHGSFLDRESMKLFNSTGAYYVPTLMPGHFLPLTMESNPGMSQAIKAKARQASAAAKGSFRLALDNEVNIAFGTDSGVTPHGENAKEFGLMVAEGMSPADAIRSATVTTAEMLEVSDDLGTIRAGKYADIIAVAGNPLEDISELERVQAVIKNGEVIFNRR